MLLTIYICMSKTAWFIDQQKKVGRCIILNAILDCGFFLGGGGGGGGRGSDVCVCVCELEETELPYTD